MNTITVTSKGQITLPAELRQILNVNQGDRLVARYREDTGVIELRKSITIDEIQAFVQSKIKKRPTKAQMATQRERYEKFRVEELRKRRYE